MALETVESPTYAPRSTQARVIFRLEPPSVDEAEPSIGMQSGQVVQVSTVSSGPAWAG
jgi:hypothetical protein